MKSTRTVDVSIHAVSPELIAETAASTAGASAAGAAASCARATTGARTAAEAAPRRPSEVANLENCIGKLPNRPLLQRFCVGFAGPDTHGLLDRKDEDLAVADLAGLGGCRDRIDRLFDEVRRDGDFDLQLRQKAHRIFRAAVDFGVSLLASVTFDFSHGQALDADGCKGFTHLIELERLDNGHHDRTERRREGKEGVSTGRYRG